MKKKIIAISMTACIALTAAIGATLAYFTDNKSVENTFTVGNVAIELTEPSWSEPEAVQPGIEMAKDPTVENTGNNNAWIRVNVTVTDYEAFAAAAQKHSITDLSTIFGGHDESLWTRASITVNNDDTVTYSYYYNSVLTPGEDTGALFTSVTIPAVFDNEDMLSLGDDFIVTVTADAIQADTFTTVEAAFAAFDA